MDKAGCDPKNVLTCANTSQKSHIKDRPRSASSVRRTAQHRESLGFGLARPNSGRSASSAIVSTMAIAPQIQPCRLNDAIPVK